MRLINADALIAKYKKIDIADYPDELVEVVEAVIRDIEREPTFDAVSRDAYDKRTQADEKIIDSYTEEVREALMRLTMCAREECGMCKYKDECDFDFQYKISTDNMNTLSDALMRSRCEVDAKSAESYFTDVNKIADWLEGYGREQNQ